MNNSKELLQKLYKIAENQQKIIRKLAQQQSVRLDTAMLNASIQGLTSLKAIAANATQTGQAWVAHVTFSVPPGKEGEFARAERLLPTVINRIRFVNIETNEDIKPSSLTVHQG